MEGLESSRECTGEGVGDKALSWVFDGLRVSKWGDDISSAFGVELQGDDVLVLACDMVNKTVSFSVNASFDPSLAVAVDKIVADSMAPTPAFSAQMGFKVVAKVDGRNICVCARCRTEIGGRQPKACCSTSFSLTHIFKI
jgi:hypothetical protein